MIPNKKIYLVGGAVRDGLLGLPVSDKDYVVVGSTAAEMESNGFKPVGKDFPVFLHPTTQDEYALARTERKSGHGYNGFIVHAAANVTLEEDLGRRDLTINAMAMRDDGLIVDPFNGQADLENKILRHVHPGAFVEDPVRILRLGRFMARYKDFTVDAVTMDLCRNVVQSGELDHLVPERVWQEISKGLMESKPSRMFEFLHECGALKVLIPELDVLRGVPQVLAHHPENDTLIHVLMAVDLAAKEEAELEVRLAVLFHDLGKGVTPKEGWPSHHGHEQLGESLVRDVCDRLKIPSSCRDLAVMVCTDHTLIHKVQTLKVTTLVKLFMSNDAFRRPERFVQMLKACELDARGRLGFEDREYPQAAYALEALGVAKSIDMEKVLSTLLADEKHLIKETVYVARVNAVKSSISASSLVMERERG